MKPLLFPCLAIALALAGAAQAEAPTPRPDLMDAVRARPPAPLMTLKPAAALDMSNWHDRFDVAYAHAGPARIPGVARTSVDRALASDDVTGSLGFLCGLEPGSGKQGAAAIRGYDPTGRFLGAKLKIAIR
jgi:hypothetical protein